MNLRQTVGVRRVPRSLIGFASLTLTVVVVLPQAAASSALPKTNTIQVTAYKQICCNEETVPAIVIVKGRQAEALRTALAGLTPISSGIPVCMETPIPFIVTFLPRVGVRPTLEATGISCGGQFVTLRVGQSATPSAFENDCALERAVVAVLPPGKGQGTREAFTACLAPRT